MRAPCTVLAAAIAGAWFVQPSIATAAPPRLRVLTFNAYMAPGISPNLELRKHVLAEEIAELEPDIVALQEVWNEEDAAYVATALSSVGLPHAHWVAETGRPPLGSSGLMTASRYPLSRVAFRPYVAGNTPPVLFHLDWTAGKGFLTTTIDTPLGPIDLVNTHVHAQYTLHDYPAVRLMQMVELSSGIGPPTPEAHPLIVAGDLNSTPRSFPIQFLQEVTGVQLVSQNLDIDLVFVRNSSHTTLRPLETSEVLTTPMMFEGGVEDTLSDHPGLLTIFEVHTEDTAINIAKPLLAGPDWISRADANLQLRATETRRWRWLPIGTAVVCGLAAWAWGFRRRGLKSRSRRRVALRWLLYATATITIVWNVYLGSLYASNHLRDLEHARETLATLKTNVIENPHESDSHH